jgi:hypothetical protein
MARTQLGGSSETIGGQPASATWEGIIDPDGPIQRRLEVSEKMTLPDGTTPP